MDCNSSALLSTAYFGNIRYFSKFIKYDNIYLEGQENFVKQTYRNRCVIMAANGPISLIIPVEKGRQIKVPIRDLKIAYHENWQLNHLRTIFSAYHSSPFFEFYIDDIEPFYGKKYKYLFDFNLETINKTLEILQIKANISFTDSFESVPEDFDNLRNKISPKKHLIEHDSSFRAENYTQVFSEKFEFVPELCILDLVFNCGPNSNFILQKSITEY